MAIYSKTCHATCPGFCRIGSHMTINNNNRLYFIKCLFQMVQSAAISLLVNHHNQTASFRKAAVFCALILLVGRLWYLPCNFSCSSLIPLGIGRFGGGSIHHTNKTVSLIESTVHKYYPTLCMQWGLNPPFLFLPHPFYQGSFYTENSHTPLFLEILSISVLVITLKLHLQESLHNLMSAIYACSIPMTWRIT